MTRPEQECHWRMRILDMARQARDEGDVVTAELLTEEASEDLDKEAPERMS